MIIDAALSNNFEPGSLKADIGESVCAVIDIIRATSTIAALFGSGVKSIIIASTLDEAYALKKDFPGRLLCGEDKGLPPKGFDHGNSPLEFSTLDLSGREAILRTTNGTVSFSKAGSSSAVFSLAALNFKHTMDAVINCASKMKKDILLICSGEMGKIAYDDTYIAGMAVKYILTRPGKFEFSDSAKLVMSAVLGEKNIESALAKSISAASLRKVGLGDDIAFCARLNNYDLAIRAEMSTFGSKRFPELKLS